MTRPKTLTGSECSTLLNEVKFPHGRQTPTPRTYRDYALALVMLDAGLRVGEAVCLRPASVWFAGETLETLTVPAAIAKTNRERTIPMSERLIHALEDLWRAFPLLLEHKHNNFLFFKTELTKHITVRSAQRIIEKAALRAYGRKATPHMLRHTFGTRLMKQVNSSIVQTLLGHASLTSTQIYCHPDQDDLKGAIKKIAD